MIDDSDGDFALLASFGMGPIAGLVLVALAIVLYLVAADNGTDCAKMACSSGGHAELVAHDCRCLEKPLPAGSSPPINEVKPR